MRRCRFAGILALGLMLGLPSEVKAESIELSVVTPHFLIPLAGQNGTLDVFSTGSDPTTSGFNALGSQIFTLAGNSTSTGTLILNLVFSGFPLGDPNYVIDDAQLQFSVDDFDFLTDQVTQKITLTEMALLNWVNGERLDPPINLQAYLPSGTTDTDDELITLNPIDLIPPLSASHFIDPTLILSLTLTAEAKNLGSSAVTLMNTPESIISNLKLTLTRASVPEPSTIFLLGSGLVALEYKRRRRKGESQQH